MKKIFITIIMLLLLQQSYAQTTNWGELEILTATQFAVQGDFANNNNTLRIELGSASENNLLVATGNINLNGTLKVEFANGFVPTAAQSFTIISAANVVGTFNNVLLPNGYIVDVVYNSSNVVLSNFRSSLIPITGNMLACNIGTTSRLYIATFGGVWSSSNTNVATINSSGIVTSISNGTTTIRYTYTTNGNTNISSTTFTVAAVPAPNAITGISGVCVGSSITLSSTTTNGVWSSLNNKASINPSSGVLTGLNGGGAVIYYTVSNINGCSTYAKCNLPVNAIPNVPSIGYAAGTINPQIGAGGGFCNNRNFTLVGSPSGGLWSATGGINVGTTSGIVNTVSAGAASVTYTYSVNGCSNSRTISSTVVGCASKGINTSDFDFNTSSFSLYPNPTRSIAYLQIETLVGFGKIVITDLYGKQVKMQTLSMGTNTIDVSRLSKGMYFVSVITSEGKNTKKLVIE